MELNKREKQLITYGLFILESQSDGGDLHHEIEDELKDDGGVPEGDEIRILMAKVEG